METRDYFAQRVIELRTEKGVTQAQLAAMVGISKTSANLYESSSRVPDIQVLARYAQVLGVSADYLLGLSDRRTPEISAIGDKLGLSDNAVECLELYAQCKNYFDEMFQESTFDDFDTVVEQLKQKKFIKQVLDETEQKFVDKFGDDIYIILKRLLAKTHDDNLKSVFLRICDSMEDIYRVIEYVLNDLDFLYCMSIYLFAEYGSAARHINTEKLDNEKIETLAIAYGGVNNFYDPGFLERCRLAYLEDPLRAMRERIIKQQEETNAQKD